MSINKLDPITKKILTDYNSVAGFISREERSERLKEVFGLCHGKQRSKKFKQRRDK